MSPSPRKPVTLRTIAKAAGVSAMTVSLALRNHTRIPSTTRESIQRLAAKLGYRPDPQVSKLMQRLKTMRHVSFQSSIAGLTSVPAEAETDYLATIVRSAKLRAEQLGYGFTLYRMSDPPHRETVLNRVLCNRGVEGVMLLPIATPRDLTGVVDWENFAVVSTTYAVLAPQFHRVVPHQFGNSIEICRRLVSLGYQRIGLVLPGEQDLRVHYGFSAAVAWQSMVGGTEFVRPLIHEGRLPTRPIVRSWFKRERPDVIIASGDVTSKPIADLLGLSIPGPVGIVSASKAATSIFAGIDERPEEIGRAAIEQLTAMIQRGENGTPATAKITMIDGQWIDGRSLRPNFTDADVGRLPSLAGLEQR